MADFKTIDQILQLDDMKMEEVFVPQWDCSVHVKELTAEGRADLERLFAGVEANPYKFRVELLFRCAANADGSAFMSHEQAESLMQKNGAAVETIVDAALRINKFNSVEEEAGN